MATNEAKNPTTIAWPWKKLKTTAVLLELIFTHAPDKVGFFNPKLLIIFLFLHENICFHMFSWRNKKNIYLIPTLI